MRFRRTDYVGGFMEKKYSLRPCLRFSRLWTEIPTISMQEPKIGKDNGDLALVLTAEIYRSLRVF